MFQHREKSIIDGCIPHTTPIISHDVEKTVAPEATMSAVIPVETPVLETSEVRGWNEELERLQRTLDAVEQRVKVLRAKFDES